MGPLICWRRGGDKRWFEEASELLDSHGRLGFVAGSRNILNTLGCKG